MAGPTKTRGEQVLGDALGIDTLLRMPDVERVTGLHRAYIYRLIQRGQFPAPYKIAPRASAWRASEIKVWQDGLSRASTLAEAS